MNLVKRVASEVKRNRWWRPGQKVVIAVSSGIDSMTLLDILQRLINYRPQIIVAHVNHELRKASRKEEAYVRKYCRTRHLTLSVIHWPKSQHPRSGTENAARQFRYRFFKRVMEKYHASILLTAHHLNDQAETILMRLIRGGDVEELTGIHPVRSFAAGRLIRPLLSIPKSQIKKYAIEHHLKWFTDVTNYSLKMTRNRVRHRLLPWMQKENPRILYHLNQYAIQIQRLILDNRDLNLQIVEQLKTSRSDQWKISPLLQYPLPFQAEVLKALFSKFYPHDLVLPETVNEIVKLLNNQKKPQGMVIANSRFRIVKHYQTFDVKGITFNRPASNSHRMFRIKMNHWYRLKNGLWMGCFESKFNNSSVSALRKSRFELKSDALPLKVRGYQADDRIRLKNGGHQKARRILIDQKVTDSDRRKAQTLMTRHGTPLALLGYKESVMPPNGNCKFLLIIKKGLKR